MPAKIVILGMGDTGVLTAVRLRGCGNVTIVAPKGGMVSGQELGLRLAQPRTWLSTSIFQASRYRALRNTRIVHGRANRVDPTTREVHVMETDGTVRVIGYDVLLIATGTTSGFWRTGELETLEATERRVVEHAARLREARTVAVVGAGPSGVSVAYNLKRRHPHQAVHLIQRGPTILPGYARPVQASLSSQLGELGVRLHLGRPAIPPPSPPEGPVPGPLHFSSGASALPADVIVWTTGGMRPNTDFLPDEWLDESGFVRVSETLEVPGTHGVFAVGDVAATDPNRSSHAARVRHRSGQHPCRHAREDTGPAFPGTSWPPLGLHRGPPTRRDVRLPADRPAVALRRMAGPTLPFSPHGPMGAVPGHLGLSSPMAERSRSKPTHRRHQGGSMRRRFSPRVSSTGMRADHVASVGPTRHVLPEPRATDDASPLTSLLPVVHRPVVQ